MRDNWLSNRLVTSYKNIADEPWTIMPIGLRDKAYRS